MMREWLEWFSLLPCHPCNLLLLQNRHHHQSMTDWSTTVAVVVEKRLLALLLLLLLMRDYAEMETAKGSALLYYISFPGCVFLQAL
jgi:hypothetical protein